MFWGPVLGSTLITLLPEVLRGVGVTAGAVRLFVNGLILLLVIVFLPNGLASMFTRATPNVDTAAGWRRWLAWRA